MLTQTEGCNEMINTVITESPYIAQKSLALSNKTKSLAYETLLAVLEDSLRNINPETYCVQSILDNIVTASNLYLTASKQVHNINQQVISNSNLQPSQY